MTTQTRARFGLWPVAATLLALASVVITLAPAAQFTGWAWTVIGLAAATGLGTALVWPGPRRSVVFVGGGTTVVVALLAGCYRAASGDPGSFAAAAAVVATVLAWEGALHHRTATGPDPATWLASLGAGVAVLAGIGWAVADTPARGLAVGVAALAAGVPAAYASSTAAALSRARRRAAPSGLKLSDMTAVDTATRLTTVVLDKNGTVTTGDLTVTSVEAFDSAHERNLRWFASAVERGSAHPIGRAIATLAAGRGHIRDVCETPGKGVTGTVDRHPVQVGRPDWVGVEKREGDGVTVGVRVDDRAMGHITVDDVVRPRAREAVRRLRTLGPTPALVSDGNSHNTERLAAAVGIDEFHPETAPEKRARLICERRERGDVVAMVGHASVNQEALEAADLALSPDPCPDAVAALELGTLDIDHVVDTLDLARRTVSWLRVNRVVAAVLVPVLVVVAATGLVSPLAGAGLAAAGLGVILIRSW